jgi:Protein of unknown function (DUF2800)
MAAHATLSASAAHRWMACPGSIPLSEGRPNPSSVYAAWGTMAHQVAAACLDSGADPQGYLGRTEQVDDHYITVDKDMVDCVQTYVGNVRPLADHQPLGIEVETKSIYGPWLAVPDDMGYGTADLTAVVGRELQVHDLKTGMGVEVSAEGNPQMMLYAGGKLIEADLAGIDIETVTLYIHQPRIRAEPSVWSISRVDLEAWLLGEARSAAAAVLTAIDTFTHEDDGFWHDLHLVPGPSQCKFCPSKGMCPALRKASIETVFGSVPATVDDFAALEPVPIAASSPAEWLGACLAKADMIEEWLTAARAEVERRLLAGDGVPGYKLVQGRQGRRVWTDAAAAEEQLKTFRLNTEQMYDLSVVSPTTAEKLHKAGNIGPRQWKKLQPLIDRSPGKPSVAPASDKRPAIDIRPIVDDFPVADTHADDIC